MFSSDNTSVSDGIKHEEVKNESACYNTEEPIMVCLGVLTLPPPLFLAKPLLNLQTVQAPLFRLSPLYIGFL